jgi:alpha-glucosidase
MNKKFILLFFATFALAANAKNYVLQSPNGKTTVNVTTDGGVKFSIAHNGQSLLAPSPLALLLNNGKSVGQAEKSYRTSNRSNIREHIVAPFYRQKSFDVTYNELTLSAKYGSIIFRAYDTGVAYRFVTNIKGNIIVNNETADYTFPQDFKTWLSYTTNEKKPFAMAFQNLYDYTNISKTKNLPAFLPVTIDEGNGVKMTITEADLEAYPGMFLQNGGNTVLKAIFAPYPKTTDYYPWRHQLYVTSGENFIAKTEGKRVYPWRTFVITDHDTDMPVNNLVYALASPNRIGNTQWIKDGKVAWDWWNNWGLTGVDFKAGINTQTYKYYIDFAAAHGLQYIILDEGWYNPKSGDMLHTIADIDLPELVRYGKAKGVGIVLWTVFNVLDDQLNAACEKYAQMGIKGFKVDFMDRDDQTAVEMGYRIANACAKSHLMLDYHGFYKPTGMNRTYPNLINVESVFGMEEVKWGDPKANMPAYYVTMPFIRMMTGSVDFTPGAMRNAIRSDYKGIYSNPLSMGTRCQQAAMYVVYDSPFTMLADAPTEYQKDEPFTRFIASLPTDVDETRILQGEVGKYIVTARRKGDVWYVGGLTNWDARDITLNFNFLPSGKTYSATLCRDGINADRNASDYKLQTFTAQSNDSKTIHEAPGGGFAMILKPEVQK